jgi:hypothetical protein
VYPKKLTRTPRVDDLLLRAKTEQSARLRRARPCRHHLTAALSRPLYRPAATSMARFTREEVARWAAVIMAADVKLE